LIEQIKVAKANPEKKNLKTERRQNSTGLIHHLGKITITLEHGTANEAYTVTINHNTG
jgi:hypothetical protein